MFKELGHAAIKFAHKHATLNAALVVVGAVTIIEGVVHILKPAPSTAQSTAPKAGAS
jgi:hypothetical protein